eukprot:355426-Chlamydomonas_euryale.AAC.4
MTERVIDEGSHAGRGEVIGWVAAVWGHMTLRRMEGHGKDNQGQSSHRKGVSPNGECEEARLQFVQGHEGARARLACAT